MSKETKYKEEVNHIVGDNIKSQAARPMDEQPVKPQKPMSIDEYIKALRKEAEVSKLRATIAKSMFEENMAMFQLNQLRSGNIGQANSKSQEEPIEDPTETPDVD